MAERLRWGILGTGNIARQFAAGVRDGTRGTLVAVGSRSMESAGAFAQQFVVPTALGSYDAVIESPDVDAIYISLPNTLHCEWTIRALRAGKHVLCEKPLACGEADAVRMFSESRDAGRVLVEAYMYRAHPQTRAVLEVLASGAIGELKHVRTNFCFKVRNTENNIRFDPSLCGGALMDVGGYCLSFSMLLAGSEPTDGHVQSLRHASGVDEQSSVLLRFESGLTASFTVGMGLQADNTAMISGSEGYVEIAWPWKPAQGRSGFVIARQIPPRQDNAGKPVAMPPPREEVKVPVERDLYSIEADAFAAVVQDGAAPFVSERESISCARWLQRLRKLAGLTY
jgi:predicted dehydrogenase